MFEYFLLAPWIVLKIFYSPQAAKQFQHEEISLTISDNETLRQLAGQCGK